MDDFGHAERAALLGELGRTFEAGTILHSEGDAAATLYWLHEGKVRLSKRVRAAERNLGVARPGSLFGEEALLGGATRGATATALTEVLLLEIDPARFAQLATRSPELAAAFFRELARRVRETEEQLENAMLRDAPSRVVNALTRLVAGGAAGEGVRLSISPIELSSRAGLEVDAVKRVIQQLRDGGYLQIIDENVMIPDPDALRRLFSALSAKEDVRGGA